MNPGRSPIDAYLQHLSLRLWRTAPLRRRQVLREVEDHLRETAKALADDGLDGADAERRAVERFGTYPTPRSFAVWAVAAGLAAVAAVVSLSVVSMSSSGSLPSAPLVLVTRQLHHARVGGGETGTGTGLTDIHCAYASPARIECGVHVGRSSRQWRIVYAVQKGGLQAVEPGPLRDSSSHRAGTAVPDVGRLSVLAAVTRLQRAGFTVTLPTFYLSSQAPLPIVTGQAPRAGVTFDRGSPVVLRLGYPCCAGSPGVGASPLPMPDVTGDRLDRAIARMRQATGFYGVSVPATTAISQPLLASYRVASQWPAAGFDLTHEAHPFTGPHVRASLLG